MIGSFRPPLENLPIIAGIMTNTCGLSDTGTFMYLVTAYGKSSQGWVLPMLGSSKAISMPIINGGVADRPTLFPIVLSVEKQTIILKDGINTSSFPNGTLHSLGRQGPLKSCRLRDGSRRQLRGSRGRCRTHLHRSACKECQVSGFLALQMTRRTIHLL